MPDSLCTQGGYAGDAAQLNECSTGSALDNANEPRLEGYDWHGSAEKRWQAANRPVAETGFWDGAATISCYDGKMRLVKPGISLLADGVQHRRPILHAIGNAIVPQVAAQFIKAVM